ncbi:Fic family protein, partial [bacterium]|nr:Fic family protein [bacterium]
GNKILDKEIKNIALVVPDHLFWFGKSSEQNLNESIWQEGFATLIPIKESLWNSQSQYYKNKLGTLVINLSLLDIDEDVFNMYKVNVPDFKTINKQQIANVYGELFTLFYGTTNTVGTRLIARALIKAGFRAEDVDLNDLDNPATKIVQQNLFLRQPYVELGKGILQGEMEDLQSKELENIGAIKQAVEKMKELARGKAIYTTIEGLDKLENISDKKDLVKVVRLFLNKAKESNRILVPIIYLEGVKFYTLRDKLIAMGVQWVMQGTGDQHISLQQVLAQPDKFLVIVVSYVPEETTPARPAIGFTKGYLNNISPDLVRDYFAEATYKAVTELRKDQGGLGVFLRMIDSEENRDLLEDSFAEVFDGGDLSSEISKELIDSIHQQVIFERGRELEKINVSESSSYLGLRKREANIGGRDSLKLMDPKNISGEFKNYIEWINENLERKNVLIEEFIAKAFHQFIIMHPYNNGNGRTVSRLIDILLILKGYNQLNLKTTINQYNFEGLNLLQKYRIKENLRYLLMSLEEADEGDLQLLNKFFKEKIIKLKDNNGVIRKANDGGKLENTLKEINLITT